MSPEFPLVGAVDIHVFSLLLCFVLLLFFVVVVGGFAAAALSCCSTKNRRNLVDGVVLLWFSLAGSPSPLAVARSPVVRVIPCSK
ncbi:hypothetical protein BVRB_5g112720 [Beta vulgaris subsp. vulgaris]|nr:hypothetical protein BVRB_5g112720 [Beta vulgaris subsp. vulgaris]